MIGLVAAHQLEPGAFLTPPQYRDIYVDARFNREMGAAATSIATRMKQHEGGWTGEALRELLAMSAEVRQRLGGKAGVSYGMPVPERAIDVEGPHAREAARVPVDQREQWRLQVFRLWGLLRDFLAGKSEIDLEKVSGSSHRALITPHEPPGSWCHIDIDGKRFGLSVLVKEGSEFVLSHPSYERMTTIRADGYQVLARALEKDPYDLDGLARAYQLLIHATPWFNGTASILETFYDAALRARGMAFPHKTSEPYFDAVFHTGVYTWRDLISCFDGTTKPLIYQVL